MRKGGVMKVRKKLGTLVDYDSSKVFQVVLNAIEDARAAEGKKFDQRYDTVIASHVTDAVDDEVSSTDDWIDHRELQDIIYKCLIDAYEVIAAREYLHYSDKKNQWHEDSNDVEEAVKQVIGGDPNVVNENGNKDSRQLVTQRDLIAGQVFRTMGLKMYPKDIQEAHEEGLIHIHDTDYSTLLPYTNCCVVNIEDMLNNGFHMGETLITKPHTIGVATALVAEILNAVSMSQFGGTTAPDIDVVLAPFAKMNYEQHLRDADDFHIPEPERYAHDLTKSDIYEAMQGLEYNINSMHANAGQVPFTAITFGQSLDWFGREIQKAILNVRIKGLNGKTAIFPKLSLILDDGVNLKPTDPNYDIKQLGMKCSSLRDYPDVIMAKNNRKMSGGTKVISGMGCRSYLPAWVNPVTGEEQTSGRQNLGVATLNLPRVALDSHGDKTRFWELFKERVELVHKALQVRIKQVERATPESAPILYMEGAIGRLKAGDDVRVLWKHKRASVSFGFIGIYEMNTVFYGPDWETDGEARAFAISVVQYIRDQCDKWYKEEDYYYSPYGTPSESLTDKFCRIDTIKYGKVKNITDKDYYTNSFHLDPRKKWTPFEKMAFESPYPMIASGGNIDYNELPDISHNLKALEAIWDYSNDVGINYLGTNVPIDYCSKCGFHGQCLETAKGWACPQCGATEGLQIVQRLCGLTNK